MAKIYFKKNYPPLDIDSSSSLMDGLRNSGMPVASSCGGEGICGKCRIDIILGHNNLSPINDKEEILRARQNFTANQRLSCQCFVLGDVTLDTTYW